MGARMGVIGPSVYLAVIAPIPVKNATISFSNGIETFPEHWPYSRRDPEMTSHIFTFRYLNYARIMHFIFTFL